MMRAEIFIAGRLPDVAIAGSLVPHFCVAGLALSNAKHNDAGRVGCGDVQKLHLTLLFCGDSNLGV